MKFHPSFVFVLLLIFIAAPLTTLGGEGAAIELTVTLAEDTDPINDQCGVSDALTISKGAPIEVCYSVENTGSVTLNLHDLEDTELGTILATFPFVLTPGATVFLTQKLVASGNTTFTGTWTAYNEGPVDVAVSMDSATLTVEPPTIELTMTLAEDLLPGEPECGVSDTLTIGEGVSAEICYEIVNTSETTLSVHDLEDSELGTILSAFPFALTPGASVFLTQEFTATATTTFNGTWTAYNEGPINVAVSMDSATLTVVPPSIELTMTLVEDTDPMSDECGVSDTLTVDEGVAVEVCYSVENTGMTPLDLHDLEDTEFGTILSAFPFTLVPGATAFLTQDLDASVTTTFNGTWTAYNEDPSVEAESMDSATLTVISDEARATFQVTKDFDDGNPAEVEVTLSCDTGLPLEQTADISEGDGVDFVVVDFNEGEMDCSVSETVPDGYAPAYAASGDSSSSVDEEGCQFTAVEHGHENSCAISNELLPVDVVVNKEWIDENPEFQQSTVVEVTLECGAPIIGGFQCLNGEGNGNFCRQQFIDPSNPGAFEVFPHFEGTTCSAAEEPIVGVLTDESDCEEMIVLPGQGNSCVIANTRLFAGIPTLSHYGLAVLALLMLGIGLIGFRRFA